MTPSTGTVPPSGRQDNLALIFQEFLTAVVRLRSNRQALTDAESFRYNMRETLKSAAQEARNRAGYSGEDIRMASLAVVGFLDESVLNSGNPIFADWPRKPLQEELFNEHMAGERVYENLDHLLGRNDSADLADLLEVHYLCMLLGFKGRYSMSRSGEFEAKMQATAEKIRRIRGGLGQLSPNWQPPAEQAKVTKDTWARALMIAAIASVILTIVLFAFFNFSLGSGASDIQTMAQRKA